LKEGEDETEGRENTYHVGDEYFEKEGNMEADEGEEEEEVMYENDYEEEGGEEDEEFIMDADYLPGGEKYQETEAGNKKESKSPFDLIEATFLA